MLLAIITFVINWIFASFIDAYILITLSCAILNKRIKYAKIAFIIEYIIYACIAYKLQYDKSLYQQVVSLLFILVIIHINFRGSLFKKISSYLLYVLILYVGEFLTIIFLVTFSNKNLSVFFTSSYYYCWGVIISRTIHLVILRYTMRFMLKKNINIKKEYKTQSMLLSFLIVVIIFLITEIFYEISINGYIMPSIAIITSLVVLVVIVAVIYIFIKIIKDTKKQSEQKQLLEQYQLEHKYSKELNIVLDNLRILKHDLKNHISCMWGLVEINDIEEFKVYLSKLTKELEKIDDLEKVPQVKKLNNIEG